MDERFFDVTLVIHFRFSFVVVGLLSEMNHILRQSARATLARVSRGSAAASFRSSGLQTVLPAHASGVYISRRFNSSEADKVPTDSVTSSNTPLDLSHLTDGNAIDAATALVVQTAPQVNIVVEQIMNGIELIHTFTGVPYWGAICLATIGIRILMLPVAIKTVQGTARMAQMRPEMAKVQELMNSDPNISDSRVKLKYQAEMQALFKKYNVNPLRAVMWPLAQFPVFIAFFMALRDMGNHFPGFADGGALWFTDLTAPDELLILPIFNSLSFLAMIELGGDGVQMQQAKQFQWIMRGMAVVMIPLTMSMPQGLFVYWSTNNVLSLLQTQMLKRKDVKKFLEIPEMPTPEQTPVLKMVNPITAMQKAFQEERSVKSSAKAEILEGIAPPLAAPTTQQVPATPPVSFAMPPRKARKGTERKA